MQTLFQSLQGMSPEWQRDLLLDAIPALVSKYGNVAAAAAAEWYEQVRSQQVDGSFDPISSDPYSADAVGKTVRWQAGKLFDGNASDMAQFMDGALNRWIQYSGRETIAQNVRLDSAKPRYARVPSGMRTCAFCSMLASRGFVYHSEKSAGEFSEWHNDCHCQIVPEWDRETAHIEGYDPEGMYSQYLQAREGLGEHPQQEQILSNMRILFPHSFTDGDTVHTA
ncbi:MAG: hypothetical protein ABF747_02320 [Bifidobacterium sp.]|uniref:Phage protein n=2 Tax=Bifidobacterium fermentum TaxID=3059035 RepID=A0AB39UDT6_9BIFI